MKKIIILAAVGYFIHKTVKAYRKLFAWRCKESGCKFGTVSTDPEHVFRDMQDHMRDEHNREV